MANLFKVSRKSHQLTLTSFKMKKKKYGKENSTFSIWKNRDFQVCVVVCNSCEATWIWPPESTPPGHYQFHICANVWLLCPLDCAVGHFFCFLSHFVVTCDHFLNRFTVTWNSFVNWIVRTTNFPLRHTLYYRFRPFSQSWWPKIDLRERVSVGSHSVSSSFSRRIGHFLNQFKTWQSKSEIFRRGK